MVKALRAKLCSVSKKSCSLGYDVGSKALRASWYFVIEGGELHRNQDLDHTISCSLGYDVGSLRLVGSISISGLYRFHCRFPRQIQHWAHWPESIPKGETGGNLKAVSSKAPEQAKIFLYTRGMRPSTSIR